MQATLRISGAETLVPDPTAWRYLPGAAEPSGGVLDYGLLQNFNANISQVAWASRTFNDSAWLVGAGPVGVEGANPPDYILGTNLHSQTYQITPSIYQRIVFDATTPEALSSLPLKLTIDYDDGVIIYLNGREIARRNLGTAGVPTAHTATATTGHNATGDNGNTTDRSEVINLAAASSLLAGGDNVLAIQLHRSSLTSSDSIARVTLETTGPGARILTRPSDPARYFVGTEEPVVDAQEQDDTGALEEPPDSENDWIELHNAGPTAQDLGGWSLTDDAGSPRKWSFPAGTQIPAGGYIVVIASGLNLGPADGATYHHTNFKLSASGDYLGLIDSTDALVDEISPGYPPQHLLHSYGRDASGGFGLSNNRDSRRRESADPFGGSGRSAGFFDRRWLPPVHRAAVDDQPDARRRNPLHHQRQRTGFHLVALRRARQPHQQPHHPRPRLQDRRSAVNHGHPHLPHRPVGGQALASRHRARRRFSAHLLRS